MLTVTNCQMFWPKSRDFVSGSLRTRHETTLARVGVLCGLNQMLIPGGKRMRQLDSERC